MKLVILCLSLVLVLVLSGCPKKKEEATEEPTATENVEGTSSGPSDANSDASPDEMQKKDTSGTAPAEPAKSE
jgi:hypothetical protein